MPRFISWLSIGTAAAFLVVATASFSAETVKWLAFTVGAGVGLVAGGTALVYRRHYGTVVFNLATLLVSVWTVVSSLVFSLSTVDNLAFANALAIAGLSIIGITLHELGHERAGLHSRRERGDAGSHLSAAA